MNQQTTVNFQLNKGTANPSKKESSDSKNAIENDSDLQDNGKDNFGDNDVTSTAAMMSYLPEQANMTQSLKQGERIISDKQFAKEMQRLKERGTNAVPPKKSASAYIIFGKEKRREILKRNPLAKVTDVVKEIAQAWGKMSKEERQKYKDSAKLDKERYERELKSLEKYSDSIKKPKKCLSAYMIFVKETRPKIVEAKPELGALKVMQEVGKIWQAMTADQRAYFTKKADADKLRYLAEQRAFYDEVEKIGQKVGTVKAIDGKITVATSNEVVFMCKQNANTKAKVPVNTTGSGKSDLNDVSISAIQQQQQNITLGMKDQSNLLGKRMHNQQISDSSKIGDYDQSQRKQPKLTVHDSQQPLLTSSTEAQQPQSILQHQQITQNFDSDKPKKPLSAYVYFCQELREIIRQKFPQLTQNQVINFVSQRWQKLSKHLRTPFEDAANDDRKRYEAEINEFKLGIYQGRNPFSTIRVQISMPQVQEALKLSPEMFKELKEQAYSNEMNGAINDDKRNQSQVIDNSLLVSDKNIDNQQPNRSNHQDIGDVKQQNETSKKTPTITSNNPNHQQQQVLQSINNQATVQDSQSNPQQVQQLYDFGANNANGQMIHESLPSNFNGMNQQIKDSMINFSMQAPLNPDDDNQNTDITSAQNAFQQAGFQGQFVQAQGGFFPHQQMAFGASNPALAQFQQQSAAQFFAQQQKAQEQLMQGQASSNVNQASQAVQLQQQQQFGNFQFQNPFNPQQRITNTAQHQNQNQMQNHFMQTSPAINPQIGVINPLIQMMPNGQNTYISQVFDEFGPVGFIQQPQQQQAFMQATNGGTFSLPQSLYSQQQSSGNSMNAGSKGPAIQNQASISNSNANNNQVPMNMSPQLTNVQMNTQPKVIQTNMNNNGSNGGANSNTGTTQHQGFNSLANAQMQPVMPMNGQFQPQQQTGQVQGAPPNPPRIVSAVRTKPPQPQE